MRVSMMILTTLTATALNATDITQPAPYLSAQKLSVNTDDRIRHVIRIPLRDGLAALEDVVFTSDREEAWMYDPHTQEWFEIGENATGWRAPTLDDLQEETVRARNTAYIDPSRFARLRPRTTAEIHIHPVRDDPWYRLARMQEDHGMIAAYLDALKITRAVPSVDDFKEMLREVAISDVETRPFTFYFGSFGGVTMFSCTVQGRAHARTLLSGMTLTQLENGEELPVPALAYATKIRGKIVDAINAQAATRGTQRYEEFLDKTFSANSDKLVQLRYAAYRNLNALFELDEQHNGE